MTTYKYKVYRVGVHARDLLEPERLELEKVGAEQIVLPRIEGDELIEQAIRKAYLTDRLDQVLEVPGRPLHVHEPVGAEPIGFAFEKGQDPLV